MQSFLIDLEKILSRSIPDWRATHFLLLDNFSSHKTTKTKRLLQRLRVPTVFTAPASFQAVPVEGLFAFIKAHDFLKMEDPDPGILGIPKVKKFTKKQVLMAHISNRLFDIPLVKVTSIFKSRLALLINFIKL